MPIRRNIFAGAPFTTASKSVIHSHAYITTDATVLDMRIVKKLGPLATVGNTLFPRNIMSEDVTGSSSKEWHAGNRMLNIYAPAHE